MNIFLGRISLNPNYSLSYNENMRLIYFFVFTKASPTIKAIVRLNNSTSIQIKTISTYLKRIEFAKFNE